MDKPNGALREALTFDDVLLKPGLSELLPSDADIRSRITREIAVNIPIIASAMDTVTEAKMARMRGVSISENCHFKMPLTQATTNDPKT